MMKLISASKWSCSRCSWKGDISKSFMANHMNDLSIPLCPCCYKRLIPINAKGETK